MGLLDKILGVGAYGSRRHPDVEVVYEDEHPYATHKISTKNQITLPEGSIDREYLTELAKTYDIPDNRLEEFISLNTFLELSPDTVNPFINPESGKFQINLNPDKWSRTRATPGSPMYEAIVDYWKEGGMPDVDFYTSAPTGQFLSGGSAFYDHSWGGIGADDPSIIPEGDEYMAMWSDRDKWVLMSDDERDQILDDIDFPHWLGDGYDFFPEPGFIADGIYMVPGIEGEPLLYKERDFHDYPADRIQIPRAETVLGRFITNLGYDPPIELLSEELGHGLQLGVDMPISDASIEDIGDIEGNLLDVYFGHRNVIDQVNQNLRGFKARQLSEDMERVHRHEVTRRDLYEKRKEGEEHLPPYAEHEAHYILEPEQWEKIQEARREQILSGEWQVDR